MINPSLFTLKWKFILAFVVLSFLGTLFYSSYTYLQEGIGEQTCPQNLKSIGIALAQYRRDNESFPPVYSNLLNPSATGLTANSTVGWADALLPYYKSIKILQCPFEGTKQSTEAHQSGYSDYWYNANILVHNSKSRQRSQIGGNNELMIAGNPNFKFGLPERTILIGEGKATGDSNAAYNQCGDGTHLTNVDQLCPPTKEGVAVLPVRERHGGSYGVNFLFIDGHVSTLRSANIYNNGYLHPIPKDYTKGTFSLLNQ